MITIKEWMDVVNYRITEGFDYHDDQYDKAYALSYWNGDHTGYSVELVFNPNNQVVYHVSVCDYANNRAYMLCNPDYNRTSEVAWDDVNFVMLETVEDWIRKATAIINGEPYDDRVIVPIDISDEEFLVMAKMAHEQDITLNQLVSNVIQSAIDRHA